MPPKKTPHPALLLTQAGDVSATTISAGGALTLTAVQAFFKKKKGIKCIGTYKAKPHMLHLFGSTEGADDTTNHHQLPPPFDATTFYGDILLVACKAEDKGFDTPVQFKPEDYEEFYTKMYDGGYDSDEDEEAEAEVEVEEEGVEEEDAEAKEFAEEEEEEEEEAEAEADAEDEDAPRPTKAKPKKKKINAQRVAAASFNGSGCAYMDAPILAEDEQLQEESASVEGLPKLRQRTLERLQILFAAHLTGVDTRNLERCIYNGAIRRARTRHIVRSWSYPLFAHIYTMHTRHIISNFHPESYVANTDLFDQVKRGNLTFDSIATMNTYELFPSRWREMFEQQAIREKKQLEGNRDRATDQFLCTRCWKRECTYYEMQTRSADEPMTIFITCLNCGKKWRQ